MLQTAWLLPPTRLLTLGFDPARFQTEPPACYRASWQLPGRDSHPLATTSLCWITIYMSTSNPGRTAGIELAPGSCGLLLAWKTGRLAALLELTSGVVRG